MSTHNLCFEQKYEKNIEFFYLKIFSVFGVYILVFEEACFCNVDTTYYLEYMY